MTHSLSITYDDSVLLGVSFTREEFEREAPFLLAAKLFELGRLSSGKASELCGRSRVDFLLSLQRVGISMSNLRPDDAPPVRPELERTSLTPEETRGHL